MGRHFTAPMFLGISCDATGCTTMAETSTPLVAGGEEAEAFIALLDEHGWTVEGPSIRCPEHASEVSHG